MELDIIEDTESENIDSNLVSDDYIYYEDTTDEFSDAFSGELIFPEDNEESDVDSSGKDSTIITAIRTEKSERKSTEKKSRFYRKWWFTLLFLIPVGYLLFNLYIKKKEKWQNQIELERSNILKLKSMLQEKEDYYQKKEEEFNRKLIDEEELKFQAVGLSKFSEIISGSKEDLSKLGQRIINELVEYVGANAGAVYTIRDDSEEEYLKLLSAYAPDKNQLNDQFLPGEGYVGTCFSEGKMLEIESVPETYAKIASGLGKALPRYLVFIPLLKDEQKLGVIEIGAFEKLVDYKIEFINKLSENLASSIVIRYATDKMHKMLEQSKIQAEELGAQEEELRQNLEEMHATQEELNRQAEENKKMQQELLKENAYMDVLMKNAKETIYFKDKDSKIIKASHSMAKHFKVKKVEDLYGKSDFDFFTDEHAKPAFEDEQQIMKTGKPIIDKLEMETHADGRETWVSTSKMPLYDHKKNIIGTFGISKDITAVKEMEIEIKQRNEELLAQEEELRQNMEEMQAVQEELQRQKDKLAKEQVLMETLLKNANESIYFKDSKSRFIKASHSMAKMFKVKSVEDMYGKTDFDFFTEEHARPAFEDEMNIIKTKKPIIDKIEKETHPDGRVSWVSTSKMPLFDQNKNVIGTFGISKDITQIKAMQEKLRIDKALLDALMNNLPDYIYFKDKESKFIRISKSMLKLFPFDTLEQMEGKSDFDFQPKESAQKYFDEEMNIIKTGEGFIDHVEHEVMENGVEQWVSTTKMPLYDETGNCIGTFGISKDISHLKLLEKQAKKE